MMNKIKCSHFIDYGIGIINSDSVINNLRGIVKPKGFRSSTTHSLMGLLVHSITVGGYVSTVSV